MKPLRVAFAGTPAFAATALEAILAAGFEVVLVLTRPDRPQGRGLKQRPGPVRVIAESNAIPVFQPESLRSEPARREIIAIAADVLVVAAYGLLLPKPVLEWPWHGAINIHASLLPRWRGAAPIERALLEGDERTGITIMQMDEGLDTGPIIATTDIPISRRETAGSLHDKLAAAGAAAIVQTLSKLQRDGELASVPQPDQGVSYAQKIAADEAGIDWRASAAVIDRKVRAFDPLPGAQTVLESEPLKLYSTEPVRGWKGEPGQLLRADGSGLVVACGEGALIVREVQRPGRRRVSVDAFLAGHRLARDTVFGTARG